MSSIKEYAVSEHQGWFIQPTITKEDETENNGERFYSCDIKISDSKREFLVQHTRLFSTDMEAANSAYANGRKLIDNHQEKYKKCMFYTVKWILGGKGAFIDRVLEHD